MNHTELREEALRQIDRRRKLQMHVLGYLVGMPMLILIWAATEYQNAGGWPTGFRTGRQNHDWDPWIIYPLIAGTIFLVVHALAVYRARPTSEADIEHEVARLSA
ncbi:MAG: 2TM domain-containing protein [Actinomycetota bacterium]|nr:2TM domain-containing protein [Actinomycetota bacterium]